MSETFRVQITREGEQWLAEVPEVPGTHTWARSLAALESSTREAIALALDLPEGAEDLLSLSLEIDTGVAEVDEQARRVRTERVRLAEAEVELQRSTQELARRVLDSGLSARDAARLLGVSVQRISQIAPRRPRDDPRFA